MPVRAARPEDAAAIRRVHVEAFEREAEADLVEALEPLIVMSLVAEADDGSVVGNVVVSRATVGDVPILALAPLGVLPTHREAGHGFELVRAAVATAKRTDFPVMVVIGRPSYYGKLGFEPARRLGLKTTFKVPREVWRAVRLPAWDDALKGTVQYPDAFRAV